MRKLARLHGIPLLTTTCSPAAMTIIRSLLFILVFGLLPFAAVGAVATTININTASSDQLTALHGIGEVKAAAIVAHRTAHGPFRSVDDLVEVKGIGPKLVEKNRNAVTVAGKS